MLINELNTQRPTPNCFSLQNYTKTHYIYPSECVINVHSSVTRSGDHLLIKASGALMGRKGDRDQSSPSDFHNMPTPQEKRQILVFKKPEAVSFLYVLPKKRTIDNCKIILSFYSVYFCGWGWMTCGGQRMRKADCILVNEKQGPWIHIVLQWDLL